MFRKRVFTDRNDAGGQLAERLRDHPAIQQTDVSKLLVLSIPRGGVVLGDVVARVLGCAHDVAIVKKVGFPGQAELAVGAMTEDEQVFLDRAIVNHYDLTPTRLAPMIQATRSKVRQYIEVMREGRTLDLQGKSVILIDDGAATGATVKIAIRWIKATFGEQTPVIVAIPVCPPRVADILESMADHFICLMCPKSFIAVSQFYREFDQVSHENVRAILHASRGT